MNDNDSGLSQIYPTPTAGDHARNTVPPSVGKKRGYDLSMKVVELEAKEKNMMFPTPRASSAMAAKLSPNLAKRAKAFGNLEEVMSAIFFPTPTANEDAAGRPEGKMQRMLGNHPAVRYTGEGTLNPDWVESYLMDYPIGWTRVSSEFQESQPKSKTEQHDSKPSEMPSSPQSQKSSQEQS
jgi:hypothetical protein